MVNETIKKFSEEEYLTKNTAFIKSFILNQKIDYFWFNNWNEKLTNMDKHVEEINNQFFFGLVEINDNRMPICVLASIAYEKDQEKFTLREKLEVVQELFSLSDGVADTQSGRFCTKVNYLVGKP